MGKWKNIFGLMPILFLCLVILSGCASFAKLAETSKTDFDKPAALTIKVLDIGQGDAILIKTKNQTVLIDSGDIPEKAKLMAHLAGENVTVLDKVIITHPHADHLGGMPEVIKKIKVKEIYDSGQTHTSNLFRQYLTAVKKHDIPFKMLKNGDTINLEDNISLKILSPEKKFITGSNSDLNNNSIVAKLVFEDFSMLFTGDIEKEAEQNLVKKYGKTLKSTILKSPHHGSKTSSTAPFLHAVKPESVVISFSADNTYGYPHKSTLKRYADQRIKVYRTDIDKTVTIRSDGKSYTISKGN